ncbi:hypothetical protein GE061_004039, partial [Apolygus lucorum]
MFARVAALIDDLFRGHVHVLLDRAHARVLWVRHHLKTRKDTQKKTQ